jgi:oligosaccharyltransferase complex subunit epsilon
LSYSLSRSLMEIASIISEFKEKYKSNTPKLLQICDIFLLYVLITGIVQFLYCCLVGTFPFNSFLAGFISTVGTFVLTVCLRIQVGSDSIFRGLSKERAFFDYLFANFILHLWVMNFMG